MSPPLLQGQSVSADTDERSNRMSLDLTPNRATTATTPSSSSYLISASPHLIPRQHQSPYTAATLLQDHHSHLGTLTRLPPSDVVVLLTPQAIPITHDPNDLCDPFQPLGRAIAERHARIRHVPYTTRNGITSTHVGFIKRAAVLIMILSDLSLKARPAPPRGEEDVSEPEEREEEILQIRFAAVARAAFANYGDRERPRERPFILIVSCALSETNRRILEYNFGTVLCAKGYSQPALESTAALMFGDHGAFASTTRTGHQEGRPDHGSGPGGGGAPQSGQPLNPFTVQVTRPPDLARSPAPSHAMVTQATLNPEIRSPLTPAVPPRRSYKWIPEQWDETQDLASVHALWNQTIDSRFRIASATQLAELLNRAGYARHYVVRSPPPLSGPATNGTATGRILGFAATYLTYIDQEGEKLLGSLAILLVNPSFQDRGIGNTLHDYAISQLKDTMGVRRLQLGSLWPRLLFGPLCGPRSGYGDALTAEKEMEQEQKIIRWFRKRDWPIASTTTSPGFGTKAIGPGQGKPVHDLILSFTSWKLIIPVISAPRSHRPSTSPKSKRQKIGSAPLPEADTNPNERAEKMRAMKSQITFRSCTQADMASVLGLVDEAADGEGDNLGWYDQYSRLSNEVYVKDIMIATTIASAPSSFSSSSALLNPKNGNGKAVAGKKNGVGGVGSGIERTRLVGCALTYTPVGGNPVAADLPWAGLSSGGGGDTGGVCCVCVSSTVDREALMIGLLDACVQHLHSQGMRRLFLDTVRNHLEWFEELGFTEWARYRDIWRDIEPEGEEDGGSGDHNMDS